MNTNKSIVATTLVLAAVSLIAGCSGSKSTLPAPAATPQSVHPASAQFVVRIPHSLPSSTQRKPLYISPSTQSMKVAVTGQSGAQIFNLTPGSPNCSSGTGTLVCTETVTAPVGNDTFTVTLYDQTNAAGNALSTGSLTQAIAAGANTVNITLGGIVASMILAPIANQNLVTGAGPYTLVGSEPQTFAVTLKDADGNVIMGPGTPAAPSVTSGNPFTLSVNQSAGSAQFNIHALQIGTTTLSASLGGVTAAATITSVEGIWVAGDTRISIFSGVDVLTASGSVNISPVGQILGSATGLTGVSGVQVAADGSVYVLNGDGNIMIYAPSDVATIGGSSPSNLTPRAVFNSANEGLSAPKGMFLTANGDLFVTYTTDTVASSPAIALYGGSGLATVGGSVGAPADLKPSGTIAGNLVALTAPQGVLVDGNGFNTGHIVVVDSAAPAVNFYSIAANGTNGNFAPQGIITGASTQLNSPLGVAKDSSDDFIISNTAGDTSGSVIMFTGTQVGNVLAGGSGNIAPVKATNSVSSPSFIWVDSIGNLLVPNPSNNSFSVFNTPLAGSDTAAIVNIGSQTFLHSPTSMATAK